MAGRTDRASIQLRVQELINSTQEPITDHEALKRVLAERYKDDPDGLLEYATSMGRTALRGLRKRTYELPEQDGLFEIPPVIAISTPDGDLFMAREQANFDQVVQWIREGLQHHSTQNLRFERFRLAVEPLRGTIPGDTPWWTARAMLAGVLAAVE